MEPMSCCFTGHRAEKLPWRYDEQDPRCLVLKKAIYDCIEALYESGCRRYLCGMAEGCDLYFCEAVLALRAEHPDVVLEAAVPFPGQAERWPREAREKYARLLSECDEITVLSEGYAPGCMMKRNRYMVDHSDIVLTCYDGKSGGTLNTLHYAIDKHRKILHLSPE